MKKLIHSFQDLSDWIEKIRGVQIKGVYRAEFTKLNPNRSPDQNKLYWVFINAIAQQADYGYTADEWHEYYKAKFLPKNSILGLSVSGSTAKLNTKEFAEYLELVHRDATQEHDVELYFPGDREFLEFYEHYLK